MKALITLLAIFTVGIASAQTTYGPYRGTTFVVSQSGSNADLTISGSPSSDGVYRVVDAPFVVSLHPRVAPETTYIPASRFLGPGVEDFAVTGLVFHGNNPYSEGTDASGILNFEEDETSVGLDNPQEGYYTLSIEIMDGPNNGVVITNVIRFNYLGVVRGPIFFQSLGTRIYWNEGGEGYRVRFKGGSNPANGHFLPTISTLNGATGFQPKATGNHYLINPTGEVVGCVYINFQGSRESCR